MYKLAGDLLLCAIVFRCDPIKRSAVALDSEVVENS